MKIAHTRVAYAAFPLLGPFPSPSPAVSPTALSSPDVQVTPTTPTVVKEKPTPEAHAHLLSVLIGGMIWLDRNQDGIAQQDELPVGGIKVHLYNATGSTIFQTTVTTQDGYYSFHVSPYYHYMIKLDAPEDYFNGPLQGYRLASTTSAHLPSPATAIGNGNYPYMVVPAVLPGQNNFSFSFGFVKSEPQLHILQFNTSGTAGLIGQQVDFVLVTSNQPDAAPINDPLHITVAMLLPVGFDVVATQGRAWQMDMETQHSYTKVLATYHDKRVILPGMILPPIIISGVFTNDATRSFATTASVQLKSKGKALSHDQNVTRLHVGSLAELSQRIYLSSEHGKSVRQPLQMDTPTPNPAAPFYPDLPHTGSCFTGSCHQ
jgi:hypothetical protein